MPLWDPGKTFQIIDTRRPYQHNVICIGRDTDRFNARCSRAIETEYSARAGAASEALQHLAETSPLIVTDEQLWNLATQCLCRTHASQVESVKVELRERLQPAAELYRARRALVYTFLFAGLADLRNRGGTGGTGALSRPT